MTRRHLGASDDHLRDKVDPEIVRLFEAGDETERGALVLLDLPPVDRLAQEAACKAVVDGFPAVGARIEATLSAMGLLIVTGTPSALLEIARLAGVRYIELGGEMKLVE